MIDCTEYIAQRQQRINNLLNKVLPSANITPKKLHSAMRYAVLTGGKRIRPLLVYASGEAFGANLADLDLPAAAIELIHCYSLVHDDLPAMDDDDLRRGQPSCHKAFDEATAILAGNALLNLSFELLVNNKNNSLQTSQILKILIEANGSQGLIGGQALEFELDSAKIIPEQQDQINSLKTGALIRGALKSGAIIAKASPDQLSILDEYAKNLGLAFQIQDDLLDDENKDSSTQSRLYEMKHKMQTSLTKLRINTSLLQSITDHIMARKY